MDWSVKTFDKATPLSSLEKLEDELSELRNELNKFATGYTRGVVEEYVDVMMCLLHSAAVKGISLEELNNMFYAKLLKNMNRKWKLNSNNTYSHEKEM